MQNIRSYKELRVYQAAIDAAMHIFEITKRFPVEERFAMVDQMPSITISLFEYRRSMAQASLSCSFCK